MIPFILWFLVGDSTDNEKYSQIMIKALFGNMQ